MSKLPPGYIPMTHHQFTSTSSGMNGGNGRSAQSDTSGGRPSNGKSPSNKSRSAGASSSNPKRNNNNPRPKRRRPRTPETESSE